jgi:hypothetical protein
VAAVGRTGNYAVGVTLPAWATDPSMLLLTEEQYDALPEDVCRTTEVVYGHVVFLQAPVTCRASGHPYPGVLMTS